MFKKQNIALWLLIAADEQRELPTIDGKAVPLITPGQRAGVPLAWVYNHHRGTDAADVGAGQAVVDYLNAELRALREGGPGGVGLWTRYLVTGERPKPEDAGVVASTLYHLDADSRRFGGGIVRVSLASIDSGAVPPFRVARSVLAWLRANAPADVLAPEYAERPITRRTAEPLVIDDEGDD
mgnify:CR=1 FL=1